MPVYLRKTQAIPSPSENDEQENDRSNEFIGDPDQFRDILPQPFRMIDKILTGITDDVWNIISDQENARLEDMSRIRPPQYECGVQVQLSSQPTCLADSQDGRYVFIGCEDGLAAVEACSHNFVVLWNEENVHINSIDVSFLADQIYLLSTIDNLGIGRLFAFGGDKFYLLKIINEQQEGTAKSVVSKCESSLHGDFIGTEYENPETKERWLEFHKLPKESWLKELEGYNPMIAKILAMAESGSSVMHNQTEDAAVDRAADSDKQSPQPNSEVTPAPSSGDKSSYKFTSITLVLRVKQPTPLTGTSLNSAHQLCKAMDIGDVIGSGANHMLTAHHLDIKQEVFNHLHSQFIPYLPKQETENPVEAQFHFLPAGRLNPSGLEQLAMKGHPTSVAVWWTGKTQMMHYSLIKNAKDIELKPDLVQSFTSPIIATAVSDCFSRLAVALKSGNVVLIDVYLGVEKLVIHVTDTSPIRQIFFLDASLSSPKEDNFPPYPTTVQAHLVVLCEDGHLLLVNSDGVKELSRLEKKDSMYTNVMPFKGMPQLIVTSRQDGHVYLHDIMSGSVICEVTLPHPFTLSVPSYLCPAGKGQMLYMKADCNSSIVKLYVFQTRSFPTLDRYWKNIPEERSYLVHSTATNRIDSLFRERISQQAMRQSRMQARWFQLKDELVLIQQLRETGILKRNQVPAPVAGQ